MIGGARLERGMGKKAGDEWAVPLCADHHREAHGFGNEWKFWIKHEEDPFEWLKTQE